MRRDIRWRAWSFILLGVLFVTAREARACDNYTNGWVSGVASYWHGTLGRVDFCNKPEIGLGADRRQKAADCAWNFTIQGFASQPPTQPACARQMIEESPQGKADLDEFDRIWKVRSGMDCSAASISLFAPHWHGALGKSEYCNNADIGNHGSMGPDRERAKECAFQALVRDKGVAPTSCLRDAIASSPQGKADLDEFMRIWGVSTGTICSPDVISLFAPHWHGALGKEEYCNNASIGPDREKAKECAFQALVRDKGVALNSCLRDAIADSPQGKADLHDFVAIWCHHQGKEFCSDSGLCFEWNDPQNCGKCNNACTADRTCCRPHMDRADFEQGIACRNLSVETENCGACGNKCTGGKTCQAGQCACPPGHTDCGGTCRSLGSDPSNCGTCGTVCQGAGKICAAGQCACPSWTTTCGIDCRNLSNDVRNCGACGAVCPGAGKICAAGQCACPAGSTTCGGGIDCKDLSNDAQNCGACGTACAGGMVCTGGKCACPSGTANCGGTCKDTSSDEANCGGCGKTCSAGQQCCSGGCKDTASDAQNCGSCGTTCPASCSATRTCRFGSCLTPNQYDYLVEVLPNRCAAATYSTLAFTPSEALSCAQYQFPPTQYLLGYYSTARSFDYAATCTYSASGQSTCTDVRLNAALSIDDGLSCVRSQWINCSVTTGQCP